MWKYGWYLNFMKIMKILHIELHDSLLILLFCELHGCFLDEFWLVKDDVRNELQVMGW